MPNWVPDIELHDMDPDHGPYDLGEDITEDTSGYNPYVGLHGKTYHQYPDVPDIQVYEVNQNHKEVRAYLEEKYGKDAVRNIGITGNRGEAMNVPNMNLENLTDRQLAILMENTETERQKRNKDRAFQEPVPTVTMPFPMVAFTKKFNGSKAYRYVAVRSPKGWSVSGRTTMNGISWRALLNFVRSDEANPNEALASLAVTTVAFYVASERDRKLMLGQLPDDGPNYSRAEDGFGNYS